MVDKKLSEFGLVQPSDVSDFVVLYLDENLSQKNGRLSFNSFVSMLALLSENNTFTGNNTFSGDVVFEEPATFNKPINGTAARATADASGNNIENTYATKTELDQKSSFKLFHHDWFDYLLNDQSWLRADTFSWQDGTVYSNAYNHLVADYNGGTSQTETVGSYTITYYLATDGHKIVLPDQETTVQNIYNESGVAWYYILDTANQRFKLPRENPAREVLGQSAPVVGTGIALGLRAENGSSVVSDSFGMFYNPNSSIALDICTAASGTSAGTAVTTGGARTKTMSVGVSTSEENSGLVAKLSSEIGIYKGQQYLYFYVGQFSQSATEQTAGLNSELFNGKVDLDGNNATFAHIVETYSNGTSWYRVWSDGWCEQGGMQTTNLTNNNATVLLLKTMSNTNYSIQISPLKASSSNSYNLCSYGDVTTSSFKIYAQGGIGSTQSWQACGYIS